ncbi:MAG: HD domain-containing phosphohydrolase [Gammaproteobacteria bacterium]
MSSQGSFDMSEKQNILAVDDTPENLQVLKGILVPQYSIMAAISGEAALKIVDKTRPDLILLDIMMSGMDGYEVCRILKSREDTADIPVIFISAMSEVKDEHQGFEVGAVDYITKPVNADLVRARVKTHLSLADQQRTCQTMVEERTSELEETQRAAIKMLAQAGHYNDTDTGVHIWRMASYSAALAGALKWPVEKAATLELAAAMHDTGKIGIPDSILKAPRKLAADEWEIMKTHAEIGYHILKQSDTPIFQLAATIARYHHEKWDGSGYPHGLSGDAIPECARIVAIADVFDALTMSRAYKKVWNTDQAISMLQEDAGKHFDPSMVELFISIIPQILGIKERWDARE